MTAISTVALDPGNPCGALQVRNTGMDDWRAWLPLNRGALLHELRKHGALLFRGFDVADARDFEAFSGALIDGWMGYRDRASKRSPVDGNVFTSTDTPPGFTIHLHCESSFTARWPRKIFFYCHKPAAEGGRTPIADVRKVYTTLPAELRAPFEKHGVMYVRNFGPGVGMDWRDVFQVSTREELEAYCNDSMIKYRWLDDERLRTLQTRPATLEHPLTGKTAWFNHVVALHASSLDPSLRAALLRQHGEENLPHNAYYGNGEPIGDNTVGVIREAHDSATSWFDWQAGDVLMLDNLRYAHGRETYSGQRQVFATMADPGSWAASGYALALPECGPLTEVFPEAGTRDGGSPEQGNFSALQGWFLSAVARELQVESVGGADNFADLGGDSLSAVALLEESCEKFGIEIDLDVFLSAETLDAILAELHAQQETP